MRKKSFLWLLFLAVFTLMVHSCRNDYLPERSETYNNSSKFQLTSQRISLSQSKHKARLLPELQKVEAQFKANSGALGKVVNYGNGVSIDTDDVIYIENGPNYHTYTFHIKRENAPADAPLENLLLSPLPDGGYKEFLITYNLTALEKEKIWAGLPVDTNGKTQIAELVKGTFNSGGQLARSICTEVSETIWVECSQHVHNQSNVEDWINCQAPTKPRVYTLVTMNCIEENDNTFIPTDPGGSGGGGGGGSPGDTTDPPENNTPPCTGTTVPTNPQPGFTDENGCPIGVPTLPNLPPRNNPCEKTKAMLERPEVKKGIDSIKAQALKTLSNINAGEKGFREKNDGTVVPADVNSSHKVVYNDVTGSRGGYHNHTATGTHMFSPPDIGDTLLGFAAAQSIQDGVGNAYFGMVAAEWCNTCPNNVQYIHYVIQYTGAASDLGTGGSYNFTPAQMKQFEKNYRKIIRELSDTNLNGNTYIKNSAGDLNEKGLEKLFIETLKTMNLSGKVNLQRVEPNGTVYNIKEDSNGMPVGTPCP